jgi:hypothetical protein
LIPLEAQVGRTIRDRVAILHGTREEADNALFTMGLKREAGAANFTCSDGSLPASNDVTADQYDILSLWRWVEEVTFH